MQRSLSMRRLAAVTVVVFVLVLAFLAGRVRAGADPAQSGAPAPSARSQTQGAPADPGLAAPYGAPGDTTTPDGGGSVAPGGSAAPSDGGSAAPGGDPPVTHAS